MARATIGHYGARPSALQHRKGRTDPLQGPSPELPPDEYVFPLHCYTRGSTDLTATVPSQYSGGAFCCDAGSCSSALQTNLSWSVGPSLMYSIPALISLFCVSLLDFCCNGFHPFPFCFPPVACWTRGHPSGLREHPQKNRQESEMVPGVTVEGWGEGARGRPRRRVGKGRKR